MVMASRRTYADALSWVRSTRPPLGRGRPAVRIFGGSFVAGLAVLGAVAAISPENFGQKGADVLRLGWPSIALVALFVAGVAGLFALRRIVAGIASRNLRGAYAPAAGEQHAFEAAVNALAACPRALQLRFAAGWVWGPAAAACGGAVLAVSSAYFVIYAVLARFDVGVETAVAAAVDVLLGLAILALAANRLTTWRMANGVYRTVAPHYFV